MVITVNDYKQIRQRYLAGESQRNIAKTMGISRNTVKKYCAGEAVPWERKIPERESTVLTSEIETFIRSCLEEDKHVSFKKQKHTAKRIYDRLVEEKGFSGGESTIRPDAKLLFVAGAGWTKKQADGAAHLPEAAGIITGFLAKSGASLGSSKSLVDMPEAAEAFSFMSHMNQVGQTGATPRHPKGLATCCHGEEPHVVGWRFVTERRAVNLDANCGWAQGKTDVLYVADAFEVMKKVNELLG